MSYTSISSSSRPLSDSKYPLLRVDWLIILLYIALLAFGWLSLCGASHEIGDTDFISWGTRTGKQLVWICCAFGLGFVLLMLDDRYFDQLTDILYVLALLLLFVTPFIARDIKGSLSWIQIGSVNLQPAEFAKCITALAVAKLCNQYGFALDNMHNLLRASTLVLLPMLLIILQKETGSALVYLAFFLVFYREGMPGSFLFTGFAAIVYFVVGIRFSEELLPATKTSVGEFSVLTLIWIFSIGMVRVYCPHSRHTGRLVSGGLITTATALLVSRFVVPFDVAWAQLGFCLFTVGYLIWQALSERLHQYFYIAVFALGSMTFFYSSDYVMNHVLKAHQQSRIRVLLGMDTDFSGAGYNVNQSKIAIGSGGLEGKGFMNGTQTKLKYVPEQDTDFIFCTVGEEEGFVGSATVLLLFLGLILRLLYLAERQTSKFGRVYGYSVLSIFLFHVFINVGMVMGLTPVIGIPLPFFSYGGSSLWGFTLLLFIFLRIDAGNTLQQQRR